MASALMEEESLEKQIKKQMGCMAGLLQIFDRHHFLTGKRHLRSRRLPPSPPADGMTSESRRSAAAAAELPRRSSLTRSTSELRYGARSSWRFGKETQSVSLDSRSTTDGESGLHRRGVRIDTSILCGNASEADAAEYGQQHRSSSVIARLMGLEPLFNSCDDTQPELRRSVSESKVSEDLFQSRLMTDCYYSRNPRPPLTQLHSCHSENVTINPYYAAPRNQSSEKSVKVEIPDMNSSSTSSWRAPPPRRSFSDSGDVLSEPIQNPSKYSEIEKRLKIRGINETSKDLETLQLILDALHLKGLLQYKTPPPPPQNQVQNQVRHRDSVNDEAPVPLSKLSRSSLTKPINRQSSGRKQIGEVPRNHSLTGENSFSPTPRQERNVRNPTRSSGTPSPISRNVEVNANATRSNSPVKPKTPLTQRKSSEAADRRASPIRSPNVNGTGSNRSPQSKKPTVVIGKKEKIATVASTEDPYSSATERWKAGEKSLLERTERCDKLLDEFAAAAMQPSPVSFLDSSFYKDDSSTRSPAAIRRSIDFKVLPSKCLDSSLDSDFTYISDILKATHSLPKDSNAFQFLEKQCRLNGYDTSEASTLERRLIFDAINEILHRETRLPPQNTSLDTVWSEFRRIRECDVGEDLYETICGVLKKDVAGDAVSGWEDHPEETSEVVLDVESLVFKDMVIEIIQDLSTAAYMMLRRRRFSFFL